MIQDKSLSFGLQNFLYLKADETTNVTYNYYGFMDKKGLVLVMRTDKDANVALYYVSVGDFATVFAFPALTTYTYDYPSNLKELFVD